MEKPYVISAELDISVAQNESTIYTQKLERARESLDSDLRGLGKNTQWVDSQLLQKGIVEELKASKLPVISLDERYVTASDGRLGISRGVTTSLEDCGYVPRREYPQINQQFDAIAARGGEVQLVDDVVFSGDMMMWVIDELKKRNIKVGRVVCGVAIGEGIDQLTQAGVDVAPVVTFDDVNDEICERDFFVVSGSGRRIQDANKNALYFDAKYGKPEQWASLPKETSDEFCLRSLERSLELVRPDVTFEQTGSFLGYQEDLSVRKAIQQRIREEA